MSFTQFGYCANMADFKALNPIGMLVIDYVIIIAQCLGFMAVW